MNTTGLNAGKSVNPTSLLVYKAIGLGIIILFSLTFNFTSLVVLRRMREINPVTRVLLTSMTVADIATAAIFILTFVTTIADEWIFGERFCSVSGYFGIQVGTISYLGLPLVNLERFIAVVFPYRYPSLVTVSRARGVVIFTWGSSVMISYILCSQQGSISYKSYLHLCVYGSSNALSLTTTLIFGLLPILFAVFLCVILYHVSGRHARQIAAQERIANINCVNNIERKTFITFFFMTTCFTVCLTPLTIVTISHSLKNVQSTNSVWFTCFAQQLALFNSILNVIVYYWRTKAFRKTVTDTLSEFKQFIN